MIKRLDPQVASTKQSNTKLSIDDRAFLILPIAAAIIIAIGMLATSLQAKSISESRGSILGFTIRYGERDDPTVSAPAVYERRLCNTGLQITNLLHATTLRTQWPRMLMKGEIQPIGWTSVSDPKMRYDILVVVAKPLGLNPIKVKELEKTALIEKSQSFDRKLLYKTTFPYSTSGTLAQLSGGPSLTENTSMLISGDVIAGRPLGKFVEVNQDAFMYAGRLYSLDYLGLGIYQVDFKAVDFSDRLVCTLAGGR